MTASGAGRDHDAEPLRVLLAAGGTGGHLMPALATSEALARLRPCEFLLAGSPRQSERELRSRFDCPVVEVDARPLAGKGLLTRLRSVLALAPAIAQALGHIRSFRPRLVIATGGYVCGPTGIAAWLARVPLLVLEQNALPGMTTRLLRPFAARIGVSFPVTAERLGSRAVFTGNPIRASLPVASRRDGAPIPRAGGRGLRLLILGGSQGARGLNGMVELAVPILAKARLGLTVTHQTGKRDVETMRDAWASHAIPATVTPFIHNMGEAYASTDLVCARAGATTLAELTYCGLPSILVPFPQAAADHQTGNARALERAGAARLVPEGPNGTPLAEAILELAADADRLAAMAGAAAELGVDDAAETVARLGLELAGPREGRPPNPRSETDEQDPTADGPTTRPETP